MVYNGDSLAAEEMIKNYILDKRELERLNHSLTMLLRHREEVLSDIDTSNITLKIVTPSMSFASDRVQTSNNASPQERAIDQAFAKLEQKLANLDNEILDIRFSIRDLECKMGDMDFFLSKLHDEARRFIELRYEKRKSGKVIGAEMHLSKNSVWKLRDDILSDLSKWLNHESRKNYDKIGKSVGSDVSNL